MPREKKKTKCPAGKVVNPATGRCVTRAYLARLEKQPRKPRDAQKKACPEGRAVNPATGRCVTRAYLARRRTPPRSPRAADVPRAPSPLRSPSAAACARLPPPAPPATPKQAADAMREVQRDPRLRTFLRSVKVVANSLPNPFAKLAFFQSLQTIAAILALTGLCYAMHPYLAAGTRLVEGGAAIVQGGVATIKGAATVAVSTMRGTSALAATLAKEWTATGLAVAAALAKKSGEIPLDAPEALAAYAKAMQELKDGIMCTDFAEAANRHAFVTKFDIARVPHLSPADWEKLKDVFVKELLAAARKAVRDNAAGACDKDARDHIQKWPAAVVAAAMMVRNARKKRS